MKAQFPKTKPQRSTYCSTPVTGKFRQEFARTIFFRVSLDLKQRSMYHLADLDTAYQRVQQAAHRTPVLTSQTLNQMVGAQLFFKCENFQKVGAFKFRGATNAVMALSAQERQRGVATHSSGNHAQALALAARQQGIPAWIVMPKTAPEVKRQAVAGYGAEIILCEPTLEARESTLARVVEKTGAIFIHPYNDERVILGQSTAARELLEDVRDLSAILAPVGGGGLLSGTALAAHYFSPGTRVIGAEPKGADDAYRSFTSGVLQPSVQPQTMADGLLTSLGDKTFAIIREYVDDILTVDETAIVAAMRLIWERMKIIIEPSCAVPFAAVQAYADQFQGQRVGIILTGGNVDLTRLPFS